MDSTYISSIVLAVISISVYGNVWAMDPTSPTRLHQDSGGQGLPATPTDYAVARRRDTNHVISSAGALAQEEAPEEQRRMEPVSQDELDGLLYSAVLDTSPSSLDRVKRLLDHGANPNAQFYYGRTALHRAALCNPWVIQLLIDNGAGVNAEDEGKETALHLAACGNDKDHLSIVQILIKAQAEVNAQNKHGYAPLKGTKGRCSNEGIKLALKEAGAHEYVVSGIAPLELSNYVKALSW